MDCLAQWRTDLGGGKNFHNGPGGTYDCAALMCYYAVCREVTSLAEIEAMEGVQVHFREVLSIFQYNHAGLPEKQNRLVFTSEYSRL